MERSVRKGTGLVHIYCGNGKGKTTTGMGLCVRAAGYGYRVMIYQFMKNNRTSERKILAQVPNITLIDGPDQEKFSFQMTDEEKKDHLMFNNNKFDEITKLAVDGDYDVLFMDETIYAISSGLLDEGRVLDFLQNKPDKLEVILTGQGPSQAMLDEADYVSEIQMRKHPFTRNQAARDGIER